MKNNGKLITIAVYYGAFIILGISVASFGPSLPFLAEHTGSSLGAISSVFIARSIGYLLGTIVTGRVYDRMAGHRVAAAGMIIMAGALVFVPVSPLLLILIAVLFILGFAESFPDIGMNTLLLWTHGENNGPYMNGLHLFYGVGAFLAPLLIAQSVLRSGDIRWAYWIIAVLILPVIAALLSRPSPVHPSLVGNGEVRPPIGSLVILLVVCFFLFVGGEASFGGWIYTYALKMGLGTETSAAYLTSAFWGALTVGRLAAIPLSMRFRPDSLVLIDLVGSVVGVGVILIWPSSPAALWGGSMLVGLSMASLFPLCLSLAQRWMTVTAAINRWFFFGGSIGGMLVPWAIGQGIEPLGPWVVIVAILASMVGALAVYLAMIWTAAQRKKPARQFDIYN